MTVHNYFAYGSNMNPGRVRRRGMAFQSAQAGRLEHYRLRFNKRSVKYPGVAVANIVPCRGAVTEGVVYRLETPAQIEVMDPREGYPRQYNRLTLPIAVTSGAVECWVYIAQADYISEGLAPARWYLEHLLAGGQFLSPGYCAALRQTQCLPDSGREPG